MIERDAVASLRPRPCGPPLRGRAAPRNGISRGGLLTAQNTQQATTDSTLNSPVRGLRLGGAQIDACRGSGQGFHVPRYYMWGVLASSG